MLYVGSTKPMRDSMSFKSATFRRVTWAENNAESERWWAEHPLPHRTPEEEQRERQYWATKTKAERVEAGWALAERVNAERKLKLEAKAAPNVKAEEER